MFKGLFFRFLLIIVVPIILIQFVGVYAFYVRHWEYVSKRLEANLIGEINVVYREVVTDNFSSSAKVADLLGMKLQKITQVQAVNIASTYDVVKDLNSQLKANTSTALTAYSKLGAPEVMVIIHAKEQWYLLRFSTKKLHSPTVILFFAWTLGASSLLMLISLVFMRNQVRAILQLADAAEKLGKGQDIDKFKPTGAKEVRVAGRAFLRMKHRIERQIYYRTQLLAHISHDLRTPLTRIRLATEFMNNKEMAADINEEIKYMETMIAEYLDFAKEEGNEKAKRIELVGEIERILSSYSFNNINFAAVNKACHAYFQPHAFERAIRNLIDNALKHCRNKVDITFKVGNAHWYLFVEDDGKGVPKSLRKKVFQPFFKINQNSEGFGLGLASVKSIIYGHGGRIKMGKSDLGGLRVIIKVPL